MKHEYDHITIAVYTVCERCKQVIESRQRVSLDEMKYFVTSGETIRNMKLQKAYEEFEQHECEGKL